MTSFMVPVALFNFNRPHLTRKVFEIVRQIKPSHLLLVSDGPRANNSEDVHLCAEVRAIFEEINWECEVFRNFSGTNLGCDKRISSGLDWVFETVEEAIILEDDCLPSLSFFRFCEELLKRYRDDKRIGIISGNNFVAPDAEQGDCSYYFSAYALTWGWATWRRVWQQVDMSMSWWKQKVDKKMLRTLYPNTEERKYWCQLYEAIRKGEHDNAWDYQLMLSLIRYSELCVVPRVNLISNIGYGDGGTHCFDESSPLANQPRGGIEFPLSHPLDISRNVKFDHDIFKARFGINKLQTLYQRFVAKVRLFFLKRLLNVRKGGK